MLTKIRGRSIFARKSYPNYVGFGLGKKVPRGGRCICVFLDETPVYVGETGSIRGRMKDLRNTQHQTLRRSIGTENFSNIQGYEKASSKKKYAPHIEKMVEEFISKMAIGTLPIRFGRKEVEEFLINKHKPIYNLRTKRTSPL